MATFSAGSLIGGRYRIEREIGRGGMATVYLARDERHGRDVAIKVLRSDVTGSVGPDQFLREIRTTAGLSHPRILPLLDSGSEDALLFYVMPYVRGESLRVRLDREGALSMHEVLRLGSSLADALAHAHGEGIIHRDVKPGNILLDGSGNLYLADFGIARALSVPGRPARTTTGQILGTLEYMSPEQISGEPNLDRPTDVYSLACVLYEMLTGATPFPAMSPPALIAAHLVRPAPAIEASRSDTPSELSRLIDLALRKEPDERTVTAVDFARVLEHERSALRMADSRAAGGTSRTSEADRSRRRRSGILIGGLAVAVVGVTVVVAWTFSERSAVSEGPLLDATRYAVLPFEGENRQDGGAPIDLLIQDYLSRWEGLTVVDGMQVADKLQQRGDEGRLTRDAAYAIARELGAGRVVTGRAVPVADSLRIEAFLLDVNTGGAPLGQATQLVGWMPTMTEEAVRRLVAELLFGPAGSDPDALPDGTASTVALNHYLLGKAALREWDLLEAERRFGSAIEEDPDFTLALLWHLQVLTWQGRRPPDRTADAQRVEVGAPDMPEKERLMAVALAAMADGRHPDACAAYERLRERDERDFVAWFGLGDCRRTDPTVVPDSLSRTGWSFRGRFHTAAAAYQRAFELLPSSYSAFGPGSANLIQSLLSTDPTGLRAGRGLPPDAQNFLGLLELSGDSLVYVAVNADSMLTFEPDLEAAAEAIRHQRRALLDVATSWERAFPGSAEATYALAMAQALVGVPDALESLRRARALTTDDDARRSIGTDLVKLQVRLFLPDGITELEAAAALGDSLLAGEPGRDPDLNSRLAEVAVLLGRPALGARLAGSTALGMGFGNVPAEITRESEALGIYASIGAPRDSIHALQRRTEFRIEALVPPSGVPGIRRLLLEQPAFLAFPFDTLAYLSDPGLAVAPQTRAIAALIRSGPEAALEILDESIPTAGWDVALATAHILAAAGEEREALELLSRRLDALATGDPAQLNEARRLGALMRAAVLRARLESRIGSIEQARRWARAMQVLWSTAEDGVQPILEPLRQVLDNGGGQ